MIWQLFCLLGKRLHTFPPDELGIQLQFTWGGGGMMLYGVPLLPALTSFLAGKGVVGGGGCSLTMD